MSWRGKHDISGTWPNYICKKYTQQNRSEVLTRHIYILFWMWSVSVAIIVLYKNLISVYIYLLLTHKNVCNWSETLKSVSFLEDKTT